MNNESYFIFYKIFTQYFHNFTFLYEKLLIKINLISMNTFTSICILIYDSSVKNIMLRKMNSDLTIIKYMTLFS